MDFEEVYIAKWERSDNPPHRGGCLVTVWQADYLQWKSLAVPSLPDPIQL